MRILKQNNLAIIDFDFDKDIVKVVRDIPGRKFIFKSKVWTVPIIRAEQAITALKVFDPEIDPLLLKEIKARKKTDSDLDIIRAQDDVNIKFPTPLFPYQKIGVTFMLKCKNCIMADEPGMGKTIQSITTAEAAKAKKILIFCPSILKENWAEEVKKWTKKTSVIIAGTPKQRQSKWQLDRNYYISNYEQLLRDLEDMQKIDWDFIIADEATRISNPRSKSGRFIKKIKAKNKIALTGTPINNRPDDLWNIADFIRPGELGSFWSFRDQYCVVNNWGGVAGYKNLNELRQRIQRIMIRRRKEDVLKELPPKLYTDIHCDLNRAERNYYNQIKNEIASDLLKGEKIDNALVKMVRLKQLTGSAELLGSEITKSSKMEALQELLGEVIVDGNKVIVFTQFAKMAKIITRDLSGYDPLLISGEVPEEERQKLVHEFNNGEKNKVMVMTEAGAFGLNLQRANYVIHYDLSWSLSKMVQREDRAHRVGQKKNVTIYTMMARDTIDEYIRSVIYAKKKISNFLIDTRDEIEAEKLSREDLLDLLK